MKSSISLRNIEGVALGKKWMVLAQAFLLLSQLLRHMGVKYGQKVFLGEEVHFFTLPIFKGEV